MKNDNNTEEEKKDKSPEGEISNLVFFTNRLKQVRKKVKRGLLPLTYLNDLKKVIKAFKREEK